MHSPDSPMYKYGGFGLAIMNWTPPHKPFAPYLVAYLWGNYMDREAVVYDYSISDPKLVDILPIRVGDTYRVWIINKVDSAVTIYLNPPLGYYRVKMYVLDSESYQQRYDPTLDRVVFGRREIRRLSLHYNSQIKINLRGYSVAVLEFTKVSWRPRSIPFLWFHRSIRIFPLTIDYEMVELIDESYIRYLHNPFIYISP
jgi:hypothetical protein